MNFKSNILTVVLITVFWACKTDKKAESIEIKETRESLTTIEKIANAHGYEQWNSVDNLTFTFNVDRADNHFQRSWYWEPKTNVVKLFSDKDTIIYNRKQLDSITAKTDAGFTNDKFWLLMPFQLIWDQNNYELTESGKSTAPISGLELNKLTVVYGSDGGYTPGDAYDLYYSDDYILQEWAYRKENQEEPNLITTWEDYETINDIKISKSHKMAEGDFKLYFDGLEIIK